MCIRNSPEHGVNLFNNIRVGEHAVPFPDGTTSPKTVHFRQLGPASEGQRLHRNVPTHRKLNKGQWPEAMLRHYPDSCLVFPDCCYYVLCVPLPPEERGLAPVGCCLCTGLLERRCGPLPPEERGLAAVGCCLCAGLLEWRCSREERASTQIRLRTGLLERVRW